MNKWHEIWEKRTPDRSIIEYGDFEQVILELKRICGWDITAEGLGVDQFRAQYLQIKKELEKNQVVKSVFEVGCGCGANLYMFQNDGVEVGGIDYSNTMIGIAKDVLDHPRELICGEAAGTPVEEKYDAVISNSVFSYFSDYDYAYKVLEAMYKKAKKTVGIIDVHDMDRKKYFTKYRESIIENYQEKYKELPKLFYEKSFFIDFAGAHHMQIRFLDSVMQGYWNNEFVFNCILEK